MRLDPKVAAALDETGLPWEIEEGKRHRLIRLNGKQVGIFPQGAGSDKGRATKNLISNIRRAARGQS